MSILLSGRKKPDELDMAVTVANNKIQFQISDKEMEMILMIVIAVAFTLVFMLFYLMKAH